jgi:hypothetical protein
MEPHSSTPVPHCLCKDCLLATSNALFELRDALSELSLALNDLLFEADAELRAKAKVKADRLLARVAASPSASNPPKSPP